MRRSNGITTKTFPLDATGSMLSWQAKRTLRFLRSWDDLARIPTASACATDAARRDFAQK